MAAVCLSRVHSEADASTSLLEYTGRPPVCGRTVNSRRNMNQNVACTASSQRNTTATDACDNVDVARPASHRVRRSDQIAMNRSHRSYAPPGRDGSCRCNAARPAAPLRHARIVPPRYDVMSAPLQSLCETAWAPPQCIRIYELIYAGCGALLGLDCPRGVCMYDVAALGRRASAKRCA